MTACETIPVAAFPTYFVLQKKLHHRPRIASWGSSAKAGLSNVIGRTFGPTAVG
jgi:hypothetical protein